MKAECASGWLPLVAEQKTVIVPGKWYPLLQISVEWRPEGWFAAVDCNANCGGYEPFRGPYGSREAAERNAAAFGRDMLRARGGVEMVAALTERFGFSGGREIETTRAKHRAEVAALKQKHGIFTHLDRGGGDWLALSLPECVAALDGYDLTEAERTDGAALLIGYCRLLDDAGLIEEGHETERAAVGAVVKRMTQRAEDKQ